MLMEILVNFLERKFFSRIHRYGFTQVFQNDTEQLSCFRQIRNLVLKPKKINFGIFCHWRADFNFILQLFSTYSCIFLNTGSKPQENNLHFSFPYNQAFKKIYKNIDVSEKTSKKSSRIILKHFHFCLHAFYFSAFVIFPVLMRTAEGRGWYRLVIAPGCSPGAVPAGMSYSGGLMDAISSCSVPLGCQSPSSSPVHHEECVGEAIRKKPELLQLGRTAALSTLCPGKEASAAQGLQELL